jgi:hypothetical protein
LFFFCSIPALPIHHLHQLSSINSPTILLLLLSFCPAASQNSPSITYIVSLSSCCFASSSFHPRTHHGSPPSSTPSTQPPYF